MCSTLSTVNDNVNVNDTVNDNVININYIIYLRGRFYFFEFLFFIFLFLNFKPIMKKLFYCLSMLISFTASSQKLKEARWDTVAVHNRCNTIGVLCDDSLNNVFKRAARALFDNGYQITYSDADIGVISAEKSVIGIRHKIGVSVIATDSGVFAKYVLTGTTASLAFGGYQNQNTEAYVRNWGSSASAIRACWNDGVKIAQSQPGKIYYFNNPKLFK